MINFIERIMHLRQDKVKYLGVCSLRLHDSEEMLHPLLMNENYLYLTLILKLVFVYF